MIRMISVFQSNPIVYFMFSLFLFMEGLCDHRRNGTLIQTILITYYYGRAM